MHRFVVVLALVLLPIGAGLSTPRTALADGAWLDEKQPKNWNTPGQAIPSPARPASRAELDARCLRSVRSPEASEDTQVEQQGWLLVGSYAGGWGARIVQGATGFDGMCRPLGYQLFVFADGVFAGTLSPMPMDSRTDGALSDQFLNGPEAPGGSLSIYATYARYTSDDPLCCPSATSSLPFEVTRQNGKPLVVPAEVFTTPTTRP